MEETKDNSKTWAELAILQAETDSLLATVRRKSLGIRIKEEGKKPTRKKHAGLSTSSSLSTLPSTSTRLSLEILEDVAGDSSPRREGINTIQGVAPSGGNNEHLRFSNESSRLTRNGDTFISAADVPQSAVVAERDRLTKLRDSARAAQRARMAESKRRVRDVRYEDAATKIQKTFRGFLSKLTVDLTRRIRNLSSEEGNNVWIEVKDKASGDVWYYNKASGKSQWERPPELYGSMPKTSHSVDAPYVGVHDEEQDRLSAVAAPTTLQVKMSLPSAAAKNAALSGPKAEKNEIDAAMGVDKIAPRENLFAPDGHFKPLLRTTVADSLLHSRFDSISSVLADDRWMEKDTSQFKMKKTSEDAFSSVTTVDHSKKPLVAILNLDKLARQSKIKVDESTKKLGDNDLTISNIDHPGFTREEVGGDNFQDSNHTCFGCWSAGATRKCGLHNGGMLLKSSQTMLLCRNWELGVMRRRYRSEEIQEIFMKRVSSLRYDVKRKQFLTIVEQRHQIYRGLKGLTELFNFRMLLWMKIKRWSHSLSDQVRTNPTNGAAQERIKMMRLRRTLLHGMQVNNYLRHVLELLPLPPSTGSSWAERTGNVQFLLKRADQASGQEVELIVAYPTPPCKTLYLPREYHVPVPRSIPMPLPSYLASGSVTILPVTRVIPLDSKSVWLERMSTAIAGSVLQAALDQVTAITPTAGLESLRRTKQPAPCSIKFATLGRKPEPGNLCIGGLAVELLIYQLISTFIPPQYGSFLVMDKSTVSPGVSPEIIISFLSLPCEPIPQLYLLRHLEHPLNYRRAPTITANSAADPDRKHYYGLNRPEQTGEQDPHGFRTTSWARNLVTHIETDPSTFTPGPEVVSLNVPASNRSVTTHADHTYPFCEPSTRDNSSLDFFHLLLQGAISGSKSQVFTALTVQEPGLFLRECRDDLPMGHLVVSVYRSWAFAQKDTIEEFKTDDGISYWYHRRTGQTFWERPLHEEEEPTALNGGTIIDQDHPEEPLTVHKGHEGAQRRYLQGEFRKQMLSHHETDAEAKKRRLTAQGAAKVAKDRGLLPQYPHGREASVNYDDYEGKAGLVLAAAADSTNKLATAEGSGLNSLSGAGVDDSEEASGQTHTSSVQPPLGGVTSSTTALAANTSLPMQVLTQSLNELLASMGMMESSTPQEIIQLGLGMGMSLLSSSAVQSIVGNITGTAFDGNSTGKSGASNSAKPRSGGVTTAVEDLQANFFPNLSEEKLNQGNFDFQSKQPTQLPIGVPNSTQRFSSDKPLRSDEQQTQVKTFKNQLETPLTAVQNARALNIHFDPIETPDVAPVKVLTIELPLNAEQGAKESTPLLVYPELSSRPAGGPPSSVSLHGAAGEGTSFVLKGNENKVLKVEGSDILRKSVAPLPIGFFNAIIAKHIAKQAVDYLPMVPNLPQSRTVGRVKPRSSAVDWMAISFDPWSAGKRPLNAEFVPSLAAKAEKLFGNDPAKAHDMLDQLRETNKDAFMTVEDTEGVAQARAEVTKGQLLAQDFAKACSLCRHGKFGDVEEMMNQPDWNVPIDYQDDMGNTLLHVVSQNGNRRLVKLCLRRGANLNIQNLTGQTALHFAFGYGYVEVGEYLVSKGADDSIRNGDNLTAYEGLGARELALL